MKKPVFISLLMMVAFAAFSQPSIQKLRDAIFEMENDSCSAIDLFQSIKSEKYSSALLKAYAGAIEAASAQCVKGAFTKLEYFSRGKRNLEAAVEKDPRNPEIRFLRFATQINAPNFLEYDNIREDKNLIIEKIPDVLNPGTADDFWKKAVAFMIESGKLSKSEILKLQDHPDEKH